MANGKNGKRVQNSTRKKRKEISATEYARLKSIGFQPGNPWRIPPGHTRNPGGRPKLLSEAAREYLAYEDEKGVTNASKIIAVQGIKAIEASDTTAAKELRQMTEGDTVHFMKNMTDAELDQYIETRTRAAGAGTNGEGAPSAEKTAEPGEPEQTV